MRKVTKRPDGSEEAIEGSPQEVREYERIVEGERSLPKGKPDVLKGLGDQSETLRRLLEGLEGLPKYPKFWKCMSCGRSTCICYDHRPWWPLQPNIVWCSPTVTSDRIVLGGEPTSDVTCRTSGG